MADQGAIGRYHDTSTGGTAFVKKHYVRSGWAATRPTVLITNNPSSLGQIAHAENSGYDPLNPEGSDVYLDIYSKFYSGSVLDDVFGKGFHVVTNEYWSVPYYELDSIIYFDTNDFTWPGVDTTEHSSYNVTVGGSFSVGNDGTKLGLGVRSGGSDTVDPRHNWFVFVGWDSPQDQWNRTPGGGTYFKEAWSDLGGNSDPAFGLVSPAQVMLYHHKRNYSYTFIPYIYTDGASVPHVVLSYRKYNAGTNLWGTVVKLTSWTGGPTNPNGLRVLEDSMVAVRSGVDDYVYFVYLAQEWESPYTIANVVDSWVGILIFDAVNASVISHTLVQPGLPAVTAGWLYSNQHPRKTQPQVFTKTDGTHLTQVWLGDMVVKFKWTDATYETPLITFKPLPNLPDVPGYPVANPTYATLVPGWESLEFKNDELFHVLYMVVDDTFTLSWSAGHFQYFYGLLSDVNTDGYHWKPTPQLWMWQIGFWDYWDAVFWSHYGYVGKTILRGYTANRVYSFQSGSRYVRADVDWWTERDLTGEVEITVGASLSILGYVDGPTHCDIELNPTLAKTVDITGRVDRPMIINVIYDDLPAINIVEGEVEITPLLTLYINPDGVAGAPDEVILDIALTLSIDGVTTQITTKETALDSLMWDQDWCEDLMDLINTDRVGQGLAALSLMTAVKLGSLPDISQKHAEDMRNTDTSAEDSTNFPIGWQSYLNDRQPMTTHGGAEISLVMRLNPDYNAVPDTDTQRIIVNDFTFPTAQQVWDLHTATFQAYFREAFSSHTELYFMAGMALGPSINYYSADGNIVYFAFTILDWQSSSGSGGSGGPVEPTPATDTLGMMASYPVLGVEWHEEFLAIVNAQRLRFGLTPYRLPTAYDFINHGDIAQSHSQNMVDVRKFDHNNVAFPVSYQTFTERIGVAQAVNGFGMENIQFSARATYDPSNPAAYDSHHMVVNDTTIYTPQEAFDAWWYSPGHRSNLLRYTEDQDIVSYMGIAIGGAPLYVGGVATGYSSEWNAVYLTHVMLDLQETVMEVLLGVNYEFNGALIEELPITYDLNAYVRVLQQNGGKFSLHVAKTHDGVYGCRVSTQHQGVLQYSLQAGHSANYVGTVPLASAHEADYKIKDTTTVVQMNASPFSVHVAVTHSAPYCPPPNSLRAANVAGYSLFVKVTAEHDSPYWSMLKVAQDHQSPFWGLDTLRASNSASYSMMVRPKAAHDGLYGMLNNVRVGSEGEWDIKNTNHVAAGTTSFWTLSTGTPAPTVSDTYMTVGGRDVRLSDAVIAQSEGSPQWEARMRLANIADYVLIMERDTVVLNLGGESYTLIITGKSLSRNAPPNVDAQVTAKSAIVLKSAPYAAKTDYRYNTPTLASAIVADMIGAVNWEMVDWLIPADRVQLSDAMPLDAANTIVQVVGGVIQCEKDGTVTVRNLFPVAVNKYDISSPDVTLTDDDDTLSVSEEYEFKEGYNKLRIREGEASFGDSIEYEPTEGSLTTGLMRVYPSPWRDTWRVYSTDSITLLTPKGMVSRSEEELVQFADGNASTKFPVFAITNVRWFSDSLGGIGFDAGSKSLSSGNTVNFGYGLAVITYTTQSYDYDVVGTLDTSTLVLMEDEGA